MIKIAPSILSADFSNIQNTIKKLEEANVSMIHFDVMDNHFVPNLTFGSKFIKDMRKYTELPFDVHLMIESPEKWIDEFLEVGGDIYTFHIESTVQVIELAKKVKGAGKRFALSVKPETPISSITPYLELLDMVLIMTVEPGFGGQSLIEKTLPKITELKKKIVTQNLSTLIQVDGGVNLSTLPKVLERGADVIVMGSAFFKNDNYVDFMKTLSQIIDAS